MRLSSLAVYTVSRWCSSVGPSYHDMFAERSTTLSPSRAEIGMNVTSRRSRRAANSVNSSRMASKRSRSWSTRSILLTQITRCGTPSSDTSRLWRRVCSTMPWRASTSTMRQVGGRRAGDGVAGVLHVAGAVGDDEVARRRREVAVGDVDRDALLALGPQAVGEQGEVDVVVAAALADGLDVLELVLEDRLRVVQQPADQRRLAVVDAADGGEAQRRPLALTVVIGAAIRSTPGACGLPCRPRRCGRRRGWRRAR